MRKGEKKGRKEEEERVKEKGEREGRNRKGAS